MFHVVTRARISAARAPQTPACAASACAPAHAQKTLPPEYLPQAGGAGSTHTRSGVFVQFLQRAGGFKGISVSIPSAADKRRSGPITKQQHMRCPLPARPRKKPALRRRSCTRYILRPPAGAGASPRAASSRGRRGGRGAWAPERAEPQLQQQLRAALRGGAGRLTPQQRKMCADAQAMLQNLQGAPRAPAGSTSSSSASVSSSTRPILRPPRVSGI